MSYSNTKPHMPFVARTDWTSESLLENGGNYVTCARALLDFVMDDSDMATEQMWGIYHLICMAEQTIEAAQDAFIKGRRDPQSPDEEAGGS